MTWRGPHAFVIAAVFVVACRVSLPEDALYKCTTDADCAGDGYTCVSGPSGASYCCKAEEEVCDGRDNDCNGTVDDVEPRACYAGPEGTNGVGVCAGGTSQCVAGVESCGGQTLPGAELCNGKDDDCDGAVDEDFDLTSDDQHCGECGKACLTDEACVAGVCSTTVEKNCSDGLDDDGDQLIDCADPDWQNKSCDAGCTCVDGGQVETGCGDGLDNDGDGLKDCQDPDCENASCDGGCTCFDGGFRETGCNDSLDNDGDSKLDCFDPDCFAQLCKPSPAIFVCAADAGCVCNGSLSPPNETNCTDGIDNDCDGLIDCQEGACNNQSCGTGCVCKGGVRAETNCADLVDNDGDGLVDCADSSDCKAGQDSCTVVLPDGGTASGTCQSDKTCG